jgi:hypothetical protein
MESLLEKYVQEVRTGADLVRLGVVPKTSAAHISLMVLKRLQALRDKSLATLSDEMLGAWIPAVKEVTRELDTPEVPKADEFKKYALPGMRVQS